MIPNQPGMPPTAMQQGPPGMGQPGPITGLPPSEQTDLWCIDDKKRNLRIKVYDECFVYIL